MRKVSVVIPIKDEEENIEPLFRAVREALKDIDYELILVDDGSIDGSVAKMKKFADERTKILVFNHNFGQTQAMSQVLKRHPGGG